MLLQKGHFAMKQIYESLKEFLGSSAEKEKLNEHSSLCKKETPKEIPWYLAVLILLNALIESTSLNLPYMYYKAGGILLLLMLQLCVFPVLVGTVFVLVLCAKTKKCSSYQDVMKKYIGPKFSIMTCAFITLYLLGSTTSYFVAIADQWQQLVHAMLPDLVEPLPWYVDRKFLICVTSACIMLPLSMYKRIDSLEIPSSIAFVAYFYCVFLISIKYFTGVDGAKVGSITTNEPTFYDAVSVIPNLAVLCDFHLQILLLYGERENGGYGYLKAILATVVVSVSFYNLIGVFGFLTFGSCVNPDILLSYKPTAEVLVATFGVAIKLALAYPIMSFVARHMTYSLVEGCTKKDFETIEGSEEFKVRLLVTLLWFAASLLLSLLFTDIEKITVVVGGLMSFLSLIFPGILFMKFSLSEFPSLKKKIFGIMFSVLCIMLGCLTAVLSLTEKIFRAVHPIDQESCDN